MGTTAADGSAWDRIFADPRLASARKKLSADEIMTIIRHVWAADEARSEPFTIRINGAECEWSKPVITHEEVCALAGQPIHASVTYSHPTRGGHLSGLTFKGKTVSAFPNMEFDCVVTDAA